MMVISVANSMSVAIDITVPDSDNQPHTRNVSIVGFWRGASSPIILDQTNCMTYAFKGLILIGQFTV